MGTNVIMSPARRSICRTSTECVADSLKDLPEDVEFAYIPNKAILF